MGGGRDSLICDHIEYPRDLLWVLTRRVGISSLVFDLSYLQQPQEHHCHLYETRSSSVVRNPIPGHISFSGCSKNSRHPELYHPRMALVIRIRRALAPK